MKGASRPMRSTRPPAVSLRALSKSLNLRLELPELMTKYISEDLPLRARHVGPDAVTLIRIEMHRHAERRIDAHVDLFPDDRAIAADAYLHAVAGLHAALGGFRIGDVDVPQRHDHAFGDVDGAFRSDDGAARRSLEVAGEAQLGLHAEREAVGARELDLRLLAAGAEIAGLELPLRTFDHDGLFGGPLARLRQVLELLHLIARTEQRVLIDLRQVQMASGDFDGDGSERWVHKISGYRGKYTTRSDKWSPGPGRRRSR